jgi:hypothetical protein
MILIIIQTIVFILRRFKVSKGKITEVFDIDLRLPAQRVPAPKGVVTGLLFVGRLLRRRALQTGVETPGEASFCTHSHSYPYTLHF